MENLEVSLIVTVIGMGMIFIVLTLLLFTIIVLDKLFPYKEPHKKPTEMVTAPVEDESETAAVIQSALTMYLKRKPGKLKAKPSK